MNDVSGDGGQDDDGEVETDIEQAEKQQHVLQTH